MEAGADLTVILFQILLHALPGTLVTVLPLSITIGILLGLGRLAADNEIAALKASGISIVKLLPSVMVLGIAGTCISLACTLWLVPRGITEARLLMREAATKRVDAGIEERTFFGTLKNLIIYVEHKDPDSGVMSNIFIKETSRPEETNTIIARTGRVSPDPEGKALILTLRQGTILKDRSDGEPEAGVSFDTYTFKYSVENKPDDEPSLEERSVAGIRDKVAQVSAKEQNDKPEHKEFYRRVRIFGRMLIAQRFTHPLACIALAVFAFPIGVSNMGRSKLNNVSVGLIAIFGYYATTLTCERIARSGLAPPEIALMIPPVLFILPAFYLINCVRLERVPWPVRVFRKVVEKVGSTRLRRANKDNGNDQREDR